MAKEVRFDDRTNVGCGVDGCSRAADGFAGEEPMCAYHLFRELWSSEDHTPVGIYDTYGVPPELRELGFVEFEVWTPRTPRQGTARTRSGRWWHVDISLEGDVEVRGAGFGVVGFGEYVRYRPYDLPPVNREE